MVLEKGVGGEGGALGFVKYNHTVLVHMQNFVHLHEFLFQNQVAIPFGIS